MSGVDKLMCGQVHVSDTDTSVASVHDADAGAKEQDLRLCELRYVMYNVESKHT